ncbi:MAG: hypothetical protein AAF266_14120 [Planctomycetota bacterium]
MFPPDHDYGYQATPLNAVTFSRMGCDGVHDCLLKVDDEVRDDSIVIQVAPMDFDTPYSVLAASFVEYLATGCAVTEAAMAALFDAERDGQQTLINEVSQRFDSSRFWEGPEEVVDDRNRIDRYLHLLRIKPG